VDHGEGTGGVTAIEAYERLSEAPSGAVLAYVTNRLINRDGPEEAPEAADRTRRGERANDDPGTPAWLCRYCGSLHDAPGSVCLHAPCRQEGSLIRVRSFPAPIPACPACGAQSGPRSPVITSVRSQEAYDVMVLAQTMLSTMPERDLRKVLVFADSRQDAAFQAGWMEGRSLRFRVRHLLHGILAERPERRWYFARLLDEFANRATAEGLIPPRGEQRDRTIQRFRWLLLEEFFAASERQRRNSLEQLGMARLDYEGLPDSPTDPFLARWAAQLSASPRAVADTIALVLDGLRLRHAVSDPFLGRLWSEYDPEVRHGIVTVPDFYRPQLVVEKTRPDPKRRAYAIGFTSRTRATAVERLVAGAFPEAGREDQHSFLEDLWAWLRRENLLVPRRVKAWRRGKIEDLGGIDAGYQVNLDLLQIGHADGRWLCTHCGTARGRTTPNGSCPAYNCHGALRHEPRDEEHFDVVQYTRFDFVPLLPREHSAQVPQEDRLKAEEEFKKPSGSINCLVATPTLELGVDIGHLEMVLMRNVPPSPANYAQRSGRAGRRHRIGAVFTYCRSVQHDQYFYADPPAMVAGEVRIPAFSLRNEYVVRKHAHSTVLTFLRSLRNEAVDEVLREAFPLYVWSWFGQKDPVDPARWTFRSEPPEFTPLAQTLHAHRDALLDLLRRTFTEQWPPAEQEVVSPETLGRIVSEMPVRLRDVAGSLIAEVRAYRSILSEYRSREESGEVLPSDEKRRQGNYDRALRALWAEDRDHYSLSYLAAHGFLPGYALATTAVTARCVEPLLEVSRNLSTALRELTPANRLYANRHQYKVRRLDFYKLRAGQPDFEPEQLEQHLILDLEHDRVVPAGGGGRGAGTAAGFPGGFEGGQNPGHPFTSLQLIDVELEGLGRITDSQEYRYRVGFAQHALLLPEHHGGQAGTVGHVPYRFLRDARLRLVNLGPRENVPRTGGPAPHPGGLGAADGRGIGFPICTVCGETRSPFADAAELENFGAHHQKRCGREISRHALHADVASDLLLLGPFAEDADAINVVEASRIGARTVLEMTDQGLEVALVKNEQGRSIAVVFDPMPGGSGFLPLVLEHWERVVTESKKALAACTCTTACYRCLLHFRNQQHHALLDRHRAQNALDDCCGPFHREHDIPPVLVDRRDQKAKADSNPEERYPDILRSRGFPVPPEAQFRVDLDGGAHTVADFAWPEPKVLIFIDGLSARIHGNLEQQAKDRRLRFKARQKGWQVLEISALGLSDQTLLAAHLEELAVYLGREP